MTDKSGKRTEHGQSERNEKGAEFSSRIKTLFSKVVWLRGLDLNQRPLGYEPNELPGCSTPHS